MSSYRDPLSKTRVFQNIGKCVSKDLFEKDLPKQRSPGVVSIAVVPPKGLGDGLIHLVLSNNLLKAGFHVSTFNTPLVELSRWLPQHTLLPCSALEATFSAFDFVIASTYSPINLAAIPSEKLFLLEEDQLDKSRTFVENLYQTSQLWLTDVPCSTEIGIIPPPALIFRRDAKRVVLHPTSTDPAKRSWFPEKFVLLAQKLESEGFKPFFCTSPQERPTWLGYVPESQLPLFPTLDSLARFLYESGYLIGNNSGCGHLASALGLPTFSLFARKGYARLWRPGWGRNQVISPPPFLPGSRLKQKYWKQLLSPHQVLRFFLNHTESMI